MAMNTLGNTAVFPSSANSGAINPSTAQAGLIAGVPSAATTFHVAWVGIVDPTNPGRFLGQIELRQEGATGRAFAFGTDKGFKAPCYDVTGWTPRQLSHATYSRINLHPVSIGTSPGVLGSLTAKPKTDYFSGINKRPDPFYTRSFLDSTPPFSSDDPVGNFQVPAWAKPFSPQLQAVVDENTRAAVKGWFSKLDQARGQLASGQLGYDQFRVRYESLEKKLHDMGWTSKLTHAQAQTLERARAAVVNGQFAQLHEAMVQIGNYPTEAQRDAFGHVYAAVKATIARLPAGFELTDAHKQALNKAELTYSPPATTKVHDVEVIERQRDGRNVTYKAEVMVKDKLARNGMIYVSEAKITRIYFDDHSDLLGHKQDRILKTPVDVSTDIVALDGRTRPLITLDAVLDKAKARLSRGGAMRMWQMDLPGMRFPTPQPVSIADGPVAKAVGKLGFGFVKGFIDLAKLTASGLLEIVNSLAVIMQRQAGRADIRLPFPEQHAYALKAQKLVGELAQFVAQHGMEIPGLAVQALQQDLKNTQQMLADGDLNGALEKITYALGSTAIALWNLKNLPKEFRNAIAGLKAASTQAQAVVKQLPKLGQEVKAALKPGGTSFRLKGGRGVSGNLMPDVPPKTPEATVRVATRPVIPAPQTTRSKQPSSSQEPPKVAKKALSPTSSTDLSTPAEPAGRSNAPIPLPEGWRFNSSLGTTGGKIELLDPRGLSKGVAFVNPRGDNPSIARLTGITVASDRRSQGLGGKLLQQVEMQLARLGFQSIETTPLAEVRGFYQKAGYRPDAESFAGTWSKPLLNPQASGVSAPTRIQGAPETKLAGGVHRRPNGQIVLRSSRLETVLPPGYQFGPISDLEHLGGAGSRPGYTTISGHGSLSPQAVKAAGGSPLTTVPSGTRVVVLTPPGASLGAGLGEHLDHRRFFVQYGVDEPLQVPIRVPYRVLQPGETLPNYVVTSPATLNIPPRPDVITVRGTDGRPLSAVLRPNMGTVVINICSTVEGTPATRWSNLRFDADGVKNLGDKSRVNYGLPSAGDQTPPVGGVRTGAGGQNDSNRAPRPRIRSDDLPLMESLPDGLSVKESSRGWSAANTNDMRLLVRANPGLFHGIHAMVDLINRASPDDLLIDKMVTVPAAMNQGRPIEMRIFRRFEPGSQSEVVQIAASSLADNRNGTFVLKVEHAELTARDRIRMRDGTWMGHVDFTTTYPDVVRVQERLKQDPELRSFMERHQIEFARWNFALDAGDARRPAGQPKRHYAILPLYESVGRPTPGDKEVMKELSRMADSVLARNPATSGIVTDLIGADNYLIVNEGGVRKIILVDPFTRPVPLQQSTVPRPRASPAPEFQLPSSQANAVDTFVVLLSRGLLTAAEREALHRWIVRDVATGGSTAAFRIGANRAGQLEVQTALSESNIVEGTRRRVRTP